MSDNGNKKHRIYDFFSGSGNRSGRGVSKEQVERDKKMGFAYFFKLLKSKLGKISAGSMIFALCNIPFFVFLLGFLGTFDNTANAASNPLFAQVLGASQYDKNPVIAALYGVFGTGTEIRVTSDASRVLMYFGFLLVITFGLSTIGLIYNLRNVCTGEYVSSWSDFFRAIKKNLKQGIFLGIFDIVFIAFLVYDILVYRANSGSGFVMLVLYYAVIFFAAMYYIMRYYLYIQLVTCKMSLGKMFKNSLLLTALGIKRNLAALLSTIAFGVAFLYLYFLLPSFSIILFVVFTPAFFAYIGVYCTYPVIDKYVIQPYYDEHPDERPSDDEEYDDEEPVFTDNEQDP